MPPGRVSLRRLEPPPADRKNITTFGPDPARNRRSEGCPVRPTRRVPERLVVAQLGMAL